MRILYFVYDKIVIKTVLVIMTSVESKQFTILAKHFQDLKSTDNCFD